MVFATVAYSVYKDETNSIFVLNLQPITWFTTTIYFCCCMNAFFSYPLQILAAFDIAEQAKFFKEGSNLKLKSVAMRSCVILFVTGIAMIIPDFTVFLDISGALGAGVIAFVLPPLLYNEEFKDTVSAPIKYSNWLIVLFGFVGIILSVVASI